MVKFFGKKYFQILDWIMYKVAILIPTLNRSDFLIRQLQYYATVENPHPVYIGDASDKENRKGKINI